MYWDKICLPLEQSRSRSFPSSLFSSPNAVLSLVALQGARKLLRGLREELTVAERYRVADDVVHRLKQDGDPWRQSEDLPARKRTFGSYVRKIFCTDWFLHAHRKHACLPAAFACPCGAR
jgi:hypothetical protein